MPEAAGWRPSEIIGGTPGSNDGFTARGRQRVGDSNGDARVNLSDAVSIVLRLCGDGNLPLTCEGGMLDEGNLTVLDVDSDDAVEISDVIYLLDYMFLSGAAPPAGTDCISLPDCANRCD